jgi:predicted metal-dependent hydrolase
MASLDVLDYLVVHELAHLIHKNHSSAFWNEVDKVLPDYRRHVEWLKNNGAALDL